MAVEQNDGTRSIARLTHADMAARVGCSREMVSRLMSDLERGQFLRRSAGTIEIVKQLPARW
jgi:CRP/FNR family cyclic AMP-dependent transcriptional regulator